MLKELIKKPALYVCALLSVILWGCGGSQTPYSPIVTSSADFSMAVSPANATIQSVQTTKTREPSAQTAQFMVTITPSSAFRGNVALSTTNPDSSKFSTSFDKANLTFNDSNPQTAVMTASLINDNGQLGTFNFVLTGTSANTQATKTVSVTLTSNASFNLSVVPPKQSMPNGAVFARSSKPGILQQNPSVTFQLAVAPTVGFRGTVALTVSNPNTTLFSTSIANPSLSFTSSTSQTTNLVVTRKTTTAQTGDMVFTVTAKSGTITKTGTATVTLVNSAPSFTITVVPARLTVQDNQPELTTGQFGVKVTPVNGFVGQVTLSGNSQASSSPSFGFNPSAVQLDGTHAADTVLTVQADNSGVLGDTNFTVTGVGNGFTASGNGVLAIVRGLTNDYTISVAPTQQTINPPGTTSASYTVTLTAGAQFSGTVGLSVAANTDRTTFSTGFTQPTVTLSPGQSKTSTFTITATPNVGLATYPFLIQGTSGTLSHTVEADLNVSNNVDRAGRSH